MKLVKIRKVSGWKTDTLKIANFGKICIVEDHDLRLLISFVMFMKGDSLSFLLITFGDFENVRLFFALNFFIAVVEGVVGWSFDSLSINYYNFCIEIRMIYLESFLTCIIYFNINKFGFIIFVFEFDCL